MRTIQVGMIGNGKSANRYHAPFLLDLPEKFKIKTIYSRNHARDSWAEIEGVRYTNKMEHVLLDPEIELVVIATRHDTHYEFAKQSLLAGKHTLVEKPFTMTSAQAIELFALARERGVMLQGYQNRRFDSDYLTMKAVIESQKLGTLLEVELHYDYYRPDVPQAVESYSRMSSFVYGHACHTLDQMLALFGNPQRVVGDVRSLLGAGRMNDYFDFDLFYEEPLKVSVKSSYFRAKARPKFIAYGTKGMFIKETEDRQEEDLKRFYFPQGHPDFGKDRPFEFGTLIYYDEQGAYHEEKVPTVESRYSSFYEAVYDTIVEGKKQLVTPEQTIALMRLLENACAGLENKSEDLK